MKKIWARLKVRVSSRERIKSKYAKFKKESEKILSALKMETICEQEEEDEILSEKNDEELLQTFLNSNRQLAG
jgi:hypothetical protein